VALKDLKITGNTAWGGAGVYGSNTSLDMDNVTIQGNHSDNIGGGLLAGSSSDFNGSITTAISNSLFESNLADSAIGGAYLYGYDIDSLTVTISNSVFKSNSSPRYTGLIIYTGTFLVEDFFGGGLRL